MKQNNVSLHQYSEKLLSRFEDIAKIDNIDGIVPLSTSIQVKCKCGCMHVEHFAFDKAVPPLHYQKHYVELCDKHKLTNKELEDEKEI